MSGKCYVYCPNGRCFAQKNSKEGESWRFMHGHGSSNPKNCRLCYTAFQFSPSLQRWSSNGGGTQGGSPAKGRSNDPAGKRVAWDSKPGNQGSKPASENEEQIARRVVVKTLREQGLTQEEVQAKLDEIIPPKPLTEEEQKQEITDKLEKAQRQHKHECTTHTNMHNAAVKKAKELLEYRRSLAAQLDKAQKAKELVERLQAEHERIHAASVVAAPVQPKHSAEGLFTKGLAESKLLDKLDSN